jgi:hypothetical protein
MRFTFQIVALTLAVFAHISVARAQTDEQPTAVPESIPGVMVLPPRLPMRLPAMQMPDNQDPQTCPATDQKKLELIG